MTITVTDLFRGTVPLADLRSEEDAGQLSMFDAEFEGMCSV